MYITLEILWNIEYPNNYIYFRFKLPTLQRVPAFNLCCCISPHPYDILAPMKICRPIWLCLNNFRNKIILSDSFHFGYSICAVHRDLLIYFLLELPLFTAAYMLFISFHYFNFEHI